jgi:hypothetical protein
MIKSSGVRLDLLRTRIVIETESNEYYLFPDSILIPEGMDLADFVPILNNSIEAILWLKTFRTLYGLKKSVMGLQVDGRLIIPPIQGVKSQEDEKMVYGWICGYFYYRSILLRQSKRIFSTRLEVKSQKLRV